MKKSKTATKAATVNYQLTPILPIPENLLTESQMGLIKILFENKKAVISVGIDNAEIITNSEEAAIDVDFMDVMSLYQKAYVAPIMDNVNYYNLTFGY